MSDLQSASRDNIFVQLGTTFKSIVTGPIVFFDNLPLHGDIKESLKFFVGIAAVNGLGEIIVTFKPLLALQLFGGLLIGSFLWSGYIYFLAKMVGGKAGFVDTYRALAYASAPNVVSWIPIVNFFAALYALYLMKTALEKVHGLASNRAIAVLAIATGTVIVIALIVVFIGLSALLKPQPIN